MDIFKQNKFFYCCSIMSLLSCFMVAGAYYYEMFEFVVVNSIHLIGFSVLTGLDWEKG